MQELAFFFPPTKEFKYMVSCNKIITNFYINGKIQREQTWDEIFPKAAHKPIGIGLVSHPRSTPLHTSVQSVYISTRNNISLYFFIVHRTHRYARETKMEHSKYHPEWFTWTNYTKEEAELIHYIEKNYI